MVGECISDPYYSKSNYSHILIGDCDLLEDRLIIIIQLHLVEYK